jgi:catechol 2,3-dioxygenase-like lactoylglutathione lyase family enzyme
MRLTHVIKYVADMDRAVVFFRDSLGMKLKFRSPDWTEFDTGETTLALHSASSNHPAGSCQIGFGTPDVNDFYVRHKALGIAFIAPPTPVHGVAIARFEDSEGAECSVSG